MLANAAVTAPLTPVAGEHCIPPTCCINSHYSLSKMSGDVKSPYGTVYLLDGFKVTVGSSGGCWSFKEGKLIFGLHHKNCPFIYTQILPYVPFQENAL